MTNKYKACQVYLPKSLEGAFVSGGVIPTLKELTPTDNPDLFKRINVSGIEVLEVFEKENRVLIQKRY